MTDTFGKELSIRGVGKRYAGSGDGAQALQVLQDINCLLYTSPSPRDS